MTGVADICVIGAGSGGLSVAAGAAQLGRKVVLVEKAEMGGDCLNFGCVPSKALIAAARRAHAARESRAFGVAADTVSVDFGAVVDHVRRAIDAIAPHDSQERFEGLGCRVLRGAAHFVGPREVAVAGETIRARRFVIATGSSPLVPEIEGLSHVPYFTNETIFMNRRQPGHLLVLGGGPIGCELAQAFRRLGSRVTLVESQRLLGREDAEAASVVRSALEREGVALLEGATVAKASGGPDHVALDLADGRVLRGTHLLVAAGRRANVDQLGLDKAGVAFTTRGITVDAGLRSVSNRRVFAVGDCAGGLQFTHVAGDHASTFVRRALFKLPSKRRDALAPRVTYTAPELAAVGIPESEAARGGGRTVRWRFSDNDRAQAEGETDGFGKLFVDARGRILGATLVGEGAGDIIHLFAFAIANGLGARAFTNYIAPYPTRGEIAKRLAGSVFTSALFSARTRALVAALGAFD